MKNYEPPQIKLEKLMLFEQIAKPCWAAKKVGFNDPRKGWDNTYETYINIISQDPDCGSDELSSFLKGVKQYYNDDTVYNKWYLQNVVWRKNYLQQTFTRWIYFS